MSTSAKMFGFLPVMNGRITFEELKGIVCAANCGSDYNIVTVELNEKTQTATLNKVFDTNIISGSGLSIYDYRPFIYDRKLQHCYSIVQGADYKWYIINSSVDGEGVATHTPTGLTEFDSIGGAFVYYDNLATETSSTRAFYYSTNRKYMYILLKLTNGGYYKHKWVKVALSSGTQTLINEEIYDSEHYDGWPEDIENGEVTFYNEELVAFNYGSMTTSLFYNAPNKQELKRIIIQTTFGYETDDFTDYEYFASIRHKIYVENMAYDAEDDTFIVQYKHFGVTDKHPIFKFRYRGMKGVKLLSEDGVWEWDYPIDISTFGNYYTAKSGSIFISYSASSCPYFDWYGSTCIRKYRGRSPFPNCFLYDRCRSDTVPESGCLFTYNWDNVFCNGTNREFNTMFEFGNGVLAAVTTNYFVGGPLESGIYRSTDDGETWAVAYMPDVPYPAYQWFHGGVSNNDSTAIVAARQNGGTWTWAHYGMLFITNDCGATWNIFEPEELQPPEPETPGTCYEKKYYIDNFNTTNIISCYSEKTDVETSETTYYQDLDYTLMEVARKGLSKYNSVNVNQNRYSDWHDPLPFISVGGQTYLLVAKNGRNGEGEEIHTLGFLNIDTRAFISTGRTSYDSTPHIYVAPDNSYALLVPNSSNPIMLFSNGDFSNTNFKRLINIDTIERRKTLMCAYFVSPSGPPAIIDYSPASPKVYAIDWKTYGNMPNFANNKIYASLSEGYYIYDGNIGKLMLTDFDEDDEPGDFSIPSFDGYAGKAWIKWYAVDDMLGSSALFEAPLIQ